MREKPCISPSIQPSCCVTALYQNWLCRGKSATDLPLIFDARQGDLKRRCVQRSVFAMGDSIFLHVRRPQTASQNRRPFGCLRRPVIVEAHKLLAPALGRTMKSALGRVDLLLTSFVGPILSGFCVVLTYRHRRDVMTLTKSHRCPNGGRQANMRKRILDGPCTHRKQNGWLRG
jgi:hypothetical protein